MAPIIAIYLTWIVWVLTWWAAALWSNPTIKRAGWAREWFYRLLAFVGAVLLLGIHHNYYDIHYGFWSPLKGIVGWVLAALVVFGFGFSWWARIYLGRLWSSSVTRKSEHKIVDSGPYHYVRHPIYTGITLACFATAAVVGTPTSLLGAVIMTAGWYFKARLEERFLREELGYEAYDSYARRVPMLVPFVHWPF